MFLASKEKGVILWGLEKILEKRMRERQLEFIPALSGLRGLAALFVLFSHAEHYQYISIPFGTGLGKIGVALFYVLSGFLMANIYLGQEFRKSSVRAYVVARLARVLPLFYTALFGSLVLLYLFGHSGYAFDDISGFLQNAFLLKGTGVLWSVPVEIQYYALFLVLWGTHKYRWWPNVLILLLAFQILAVYFLVDVLEDQNYLFFWVHYFIIGFFASYIRQRIKWERYRSYKKSYILSIASFLAILFSTALLPWFREIFGYEIPPVFLDPFVILFVVLSFTFTLLGRGPYALLAQPVMRNLGDFSFGIYLCHPPIIFLIDGLNLKSRIGIYPAFFIILFLTIGTAWLAHLIVEIPAGKWMRRVFSASKPAVQASASAQ